jgi:formylmethanofuran dehydrogenase subunit D
MQFNLNTGRTILQGDLIDHKTSPGYTEATSLCFMHPLDMMDLGINEGQRVKIQNGVGEVVLEVVEWEATERGSVYVPLGIHANSLITAETHATGMPDFKSVLVEVVPTTEPRRSVHELVRDLGGVPFDL